MKFILNFDSSQTLPYCCGVNDVGGFDLVPSDPWTPAPSTVVCSGTGLFTATFVNEEESKAAYDYLCKEHVLLFQSSVKRNSHSGNKLFLCVFLHKARKPRGKNKMIPVSGEREGVIEDQEWAFPVRAGERLPSLR
jgi:hypothetical protein